MCVELMWRGDDGNVNRHCSMFSSFRKMPCNHRSIKKHTSKATSTVMQHLDLLAFYMAPLTKYEIIRVPFQGACFCATAPIIQATSIWSTWRASSLLRCFLPVQSVQHVLFFLHHSLVQQDGERLRRMNQIMAPARSFEFSRFDSVQCFSWCSVIFCCFRLEYTVLQNRILIAANDNRVSIINHWNGQDKIKIKKYCMKSRQVGI